MSTSLCLAQTVGAWQILIVLFYLFTVAYLGYLGYRHTRSAADFMVAGRTTHPVIMALSYGATFISTSAIVGFGGVAGMFGMSLLWLTFFNIFVGIFLAFVFLGEPTRVMGHALDVHTFPELLGRRYQSRFIQIFAGLVIFFFIPLYGAAVLIGGCEFITTAFGMDYSTALLVFAVLTAAYVIAGGIKGVMYTDAFQGGIMFFGMLVLLVWSYAKVGGVTVAHEELNTIATTIPSLFEKIGFRGHAATPAFGWGDNQYNLWWIIFSTITLGVGIGVLAQPQLVVRFLMVKSKRELNRGVFVGGLFILVVTGVAYVTGTISNVYFLKKEVVRGTLTAVTGVGNTPDTWNWVAAKEEKGLNVGPDGQLVNPNFGPDVAALPCVLLHLDTTGTGVADTLLVYKGYGKAEALLPKAAVEGIPADETALAVLQTKIGEPIVVRPNALAFTRAVIMKKNKTYAFNTGSIIPTFITSAMPRWFGLIFLLTLLSAAMSTLSSLLHVVGTSISRDVYQQIFQRHSSTASITITRIGILIGLILAVLFSMYARVGYVIAQVTAIFFGLCAAAFLPAFVGGLFFRWATRWGAISSMIVGFAVSLFWMIFVKDKEARALGVCDAIFGKHSLMLDRPNWPVVDALVVALPISLIVFIVVSLITRKPDAQHLDKCFPKG